MSKINWKKDGKDLFIFTCNLCQYAISTSEEHQMIEVKLNEGQIVHICESCYESINDAVI